MKDVVFTAEQGEFLLSGKDDFDRLPSFFAGCSSAGIGYPRVFVDPVASLGEVFLGDLCIFLKNERLPHFALYLGNGGNGFSWKDADAGRLRDTFSSVFIAGDPGILLDAQVQFSQLSMFHRIPEVQAAVFDSNKTFIRRANARSLGWPVLADPAHALDIYTENLTDLAMSAKLSIDTILEELAQKIEDCIKRTDTVRSVSASTINLWSNIKGLAEDALAVLESKAPSKLEDFERFREAELILLGPLARCKFEDVLSLRRHLSATESHDELEHLRKLLSQTKKISGYFLGEQGANHNAYVKFLRAALGITLRHTEVSILHRQWRKLCLLTAQIVRGDSFRSNFIPCVLERIWARHPHLANQAMHPQNDSIDAIKDVLRSAFSELKNQRVVLAYPKTKLVGKETKDLLDWVERSLAKPCRIFEIEGTDAWLYWEETFAPTAASYLFQQGNEFTSSLPRPSIPHTQGFSDHEELDEEDSYKFRLRVKAEALPASEVSSLCTCETEAPGAAGDLNQPPPTMCPRCGGFNWRHWWRCYQHGKVPVDVPVGDTACPDCILRHHLDPDHFPIGSISRRPDLLNVLFCPHCGTRIAAELLPFFRDGVAGYQRRQFLVLARKLRLPNDCRCPICRTLLIPVDHREMPGHKLAASRPPEDGSPEPLPWPEPSGVLSGMDPGDPVDWNIPVETGLGSPGSEPRPKAGDGRDDIEDNVGLAKP